MGRRLEGCKFRAHRCLKGVHRTGGLAQDPREAHRGDTVNSLLAELTAQERDITLLRKRNEKACVKRAFDLM